jgi:hypothetical protein
MLKRSFVLCALALSAALVPSCGGDDDVAPTKLAEPCQQNSQCGGDLICALGRCHEVCTNSKDCPPGQRCVKTEGASAACQLPLESKCTYHTDCQVPLICAIDRSCRNMCQGDRDCLTGQFCDAASQTCADRTEFDSGMIPDQGGPKPPDAGLGDGSGGSTGAGGTAGTGGGAGTGGTAGTGGAAGSGGTGGTGGGTGGTGGTTVDAGTDVRPDMSVDASTDRVDASVTDSISPDAGCGHSGEPCCTTGTACVLGSTCDTNNMCVPCGQKDQACCGTGTACLQANLDCVSGTCQCGAQSQVCCGGTTCNSGLTCSASDAAGSRPTCGCGGNNQACCANSMCSSGSLSCAGTRCTCITGCFADHYQSDVHVLRSDGTAWYYANYSSMPAVVADASSIPVTGFTKIATGYQFSCGIKTDRTVWCWWNTDPGSTMATYGQLGNGTTNATRYPVQVLTAAANNPPLANAIALSTYSNTTCAVTSDQTLYCWGYAYYGQLATGSPAPNFSAYATQALASVGVPFTGVDQVSVGQYHVCARKTDGTAFCWGYNANGQLGNGGTMQAFYPVQVTMLSNQASEITAGDTHTCARAADIALCWGTNSYGLGDGMTTISNTPINVKVSMGGPDFTGITELRASSNGACALKGADKSVWCWGYFGTSSPTPAAASPAGFPVANVYYWDVMAGSLCFARTDAELYLGNYKATTPVACP